MSETREHLDFARWLDHNGLLWLHIPNEGNRGVQQGSLLKRMGLKKGAPDFLIFDAPPSRPNCRGVAIEIKRTHGGEYSPEQRRWLANLRAHGWVAEFIHGYEEARNFMLSLGYRERAIKEIEL